MKRFSYIIRNPNEVRTARDVLPQGTEWVQGRTGLLQATAEDLKNALLKGFLTRHPWAGKLPEGTFEVVLTELDASKAPTVEKVLALPPHDPEDPDADWALQEVYVRVFEPLAALVETVFPKLFSDMWTLCEDWEAASQLVDVNRRFITWRPDRCCCYSIHLKGEKEACALVTLWEKPGRRGREWNENLEVCILNKDEVEKVVLGIILPLEWKLRETDNPKRSILALEDLCVDLP